MSEDPHRGRQSVSGASAATGPCSTSGPSSASGPPSACGYFEPYGAVVRLRPTSERLDPLLFLPALLEGVASSCVEQGASVIGHLKCLLRTGDGHISCNLTSVRSGAACREGTVGTVPADGEAELDLVVLVYDLSVSTIDGVVGETLERLLTPLRVAWVKSASFHA